MQKCGVGFIPNIKGGLEFLFFDPLKLNCDHGFRDKELQDRDKSKPQLESLLKIRDNQKTVDFENDIDW